MDLQRFNWHMVQKLKHCQKTNTKQGEYMVKHFKGLLRFLQITSNMMVNQWMLFINEALEYGFSMIEEVDCAIKEERIPVPVQSPNKLIEKMVGLQDEHCFGLCLQDFESSDEE